MNVTRNTLVVLVVLVAIGAGWHALGAGTREIAVLRTYGATGNDLLTSLWVVDDAEGFIWIRADRPDRKWLPDVERHPKVELRRRGRSKPYVARIFDDDDSRRYVAALFRAKYGWADELREWRDGRETIPVRLQPR